MKNYLLNNFFYFFYFFYFLSFYIKKTEYRVDIMNELENIINLFEDCELDIIANVDKNYAETGCEELYCVEEYVRIGHMLHPDYTVYINEEEDRVIFDKRGMEYLGYWR